MSGWAAGGRPSSSWFPVIDNSQGRERSWATDALSQERLPSILITAAVRSGHNRGNFGNTGRGDGLVLVRHPAGEIRGEEPEKNGES